MKELTLEHVREFVPYQLFEMVAPNGEEYLLELQEEDIDTAIENDQYRIKNLTQYQPIATLTFQELKGMLSSIKRYVPCWTNKW